MKHQCHKATCLNHKGRVISIGYNSYVKTHPIQARFSQKAKEPEKIYLHAEIAAIIAAKGKPIHTIKVERYDRQGKPLNSCPCSICQLAIEKAGIKYVLYTTNN